MAGPGGALAPSKRDVKPRGSQQPVPVSSRVLAVPQCALPSLVLRHTVKGQHKIQPNWKGCRCVFQADLLPQQLSREVCSI